MRINRPIGFRDSWDSDMSRAERMVWTLALALAVALSGWIVTAVKLIDARHEIARNKAHCDSLVESMVAGAEMAYARARECGR